MSTERIHQSLANKYRPRTFDELVEQEIVVDILKAQVLGGNTHSNFVFFGPRGTGKTSVARIFAKALNCPNIIENKGNPCNVCSHCEMINQGRAMDVVEIDAASYTGVDTIREEIIEKAGYQPAALPRKVYIIDEVHMLSKGAFNALLKIMEEPPLYLNFILATTEIHKIPETILSRCQIFQFKKLHEAKIVEHLKILCMKESFTYEDEALDMIADMSDGCMRDAIKFLDQVNILGSITVDHAKAMLGVASEYSVQQFLEHMKHKNMPEVMQLLEELSSGGVDLMNFARQILNAVDKHFQKDPVFYMHIGDVLKEVFMNSRYLNSPILAYKVALSRAVLAEIGVSPISPTPSAPKTSPTTKESKSSSSDSLISEQKEPVVSQNTSLGQESFHSLLQNFSKPTLKNLLLEHALIEKQEDNQVFLIILHKLTFNQANKPEIIQELERLFSQQLNSPVKVHMRALSHQEYIDEQMK